MLVGRAGLSPIMIGRGHEAALLQTALRGDRAQFAVVTGEAGVGKTRLLREVLSRLPSDLTVLAAGCEPDDEARPFGLVHRLLGDVPSATERDRAVHDVLRERLAGPRSVVVVEDVQWADATSIGIIERLTRSGSPATTFVFSCRSESLAEVSAGPELLRRLGRRAHVLVITLERFRPPEVGAMLAALFGESPSSRAIERVLRRTGGLPFAIEELARAPSVHSADDAADAPVGSSPAGVVVDQLARLDANQRGAAGAIAVLGPSVPFAVLCAVTDLGERELECVLGSLLASGLVVEPAEDRFSLRHALLQGVVSDSLIARERRRLHRLAFDAVRALDPDDVAAAARHAAAANLTDELRDVARRAARQRLDDGATFEALRIASTTLEHLHDDPELLEIAVRSASVLGLFTDALDYATAWMRLVPALGADAEVRCRIALVKLYRELERTDERDECLDQLRRLAETMPDSVLRSEALSAVAEALIVSLRPADARPFADRALAIAESLGDAAARARAMLMASSSALSPDLEGVRRARELAETSGDLAVIALACEFEADLGRIAPASFASAIERYERAARRAGHDQMGEPIAQMLRWAHAIQVDADASAARAALDRFREWRWVRSLMCVWADLATFDLAIEAGDPGEARQGYERITAWRNPDFTAYRRWLEPQMALRLAALEGDRIAVSTQLQRLANAAIELADEPDLFEAVDRAIDAGCALDDVEVFAGRCAQVIEDPTDALPAVVVLARGAAGEAVGRLREALRRPGLRLHRVQVASTYLRLAHAELALGNPDRARADLDQCLALLQRWPGWRRRRADALATRLHRTTPGATLLSPREHEVAVLVAAGCSNREIGDRLHLSTKTASVHVSHILTKLGLHRRAEIAAWVASTPPPRPA